MSNLNELRKFCQKLAVASSEVIRQYFRSNVKIESKEDASPITIADKKAEEVMRKLISKKYPEHGIIGEEFGNENEKAEYVWVLDPIDGTKSFICGTYSFGTLIALLKNGIPILGVYNQPILNDFLIGDNQTTEINNTVTKVRSCKNLADSVLLTTDHLNIEKYQNIEKFNQLIKKVKLYRNWGDCYGYYLLATGYADIMIDPIMSPWDSLALIPIIKGSGGVITDYHGNDPVTGNSIIVASSEIHSEVISLLNP
ncbi:MAG: histidinol-phosphatase [Ignavibacteriaceae bacterium]|nr:histidinol-phosphatase [Ignavibacteriaceae bacterium]